ncbi:hypothetical protein BD779DRAFT_1667168 [Infundibulicybe gibba]|nr:hypothetical protein BD779DRAFT_1667168 [Infundibulicybe gibba]
MSFLSTFRLSALSAAGLFAGITIAISGHLTSITQRLAGGYFTFAALAIAVGLLTFFSVPAMILVDMTRKGAFTSMIVVELSWLSLLWVLWLAAAGLSAQANTAIFPAGCSPRINRDGRTACHEFKAIEAMSFLAWITLFLYTMTLLVNTLIVASRGRKVWTNSVRDTDFSAPAPAPVQQQTLAPQFAPNQQFTGGVPQQFTGGIPLQYTGGDPKMNQMGHPGMMAQYPPNQSSTPPPTGWQGTPTQASHSPYPQV